METIGREACAGAYAAFVASAALHADRERQVSTPFEAIADLDRVVHEPARLAILSALSACSSADFVFLQRITGLSKGNLGAHLSRLEEVGLVIMTKEFVDRVPRTTITLTDDGRDRIGAYWRELERLGRAARRWRA